MLWLFRCVPMQVYLQKLTNMQYVLLFKNYEPLNFLIISCGWLIEVLLLVCPSWPDEPHWRSKHFRFSAKCYTHACCNVYHLYSCVLLQMLQRSLVQWQCTHGRETQPTSAAKWRLTPEPLWFGLETVSSCPLPTPPTWRSTAHNPPATWRSVAS